LGFVNDVEIMAVGTEEPWALAVDDIAMPAETIPVGLVDDLITQLGSARRLIRRATEHVADGPVPVRLVNGGGKPHRTVLSSSMPSAMSRADHCGSSAAGECVTAMPNGASVAISSPTDSPSTSRLPPGAAKARHERTGQVAPGRGSRRCRRAENVVRRPRRCHHKYHRLQFVVDQLGHVRSGVTRGGAHLTM
jgi:hypothetical protein